jgi:prepilin-type N-terminal cleavage/methylation domain-containing protein
MRGRRGFTFIEVVTVVVMVGVLATIAVLKYIDLTDRARTTQIAADINAVRVAAYNYWVDHERHAAEAAEGVVPPELLPLLPANYAFDHSAQGYVIDWQNAGAGALVGISVRATTPRMERVLGQIFANRYPFFRVGNRLTYVLVGPGGEM